MIAIIDYGMGNLKSVKNALDYLKLDCIITSEKEEILNADGVILPGVGAFKDAIKNLKESQLDDVVREVASKGIPLLGICLGMQLLFEKGYEGEECDGFAFLKGKVIQMEGDDIRIPHIGWNLLKGKGGTLTENIVGEPFVYFVHSFLAIDYEEDDLINYAEYGRYKIPAIVGKNNVMGAQFHPEKSGEIGLQILRNFGEMIK
ncbi:MAG: imidazole glycerol phosphate synthase subunit HisH [Clostridium sp.]